MLFGFLKLYKWYQIAQSIPYENFLESITNAIIVELISHFMRVDFALTLQAGNIIVLL